MSKATAECRVCAGATCPWGSAHVRCRSCGLAFRHPLPTPEALLVVHEEHYPAGLETAAESVMCSNAVSVRNLARWLRRRFPPGNQVLDFGAGIGELAAALREAGMPDVRCCESALAAAQAARARGFDVVASLEDVPTAAVDLVTSIEVLEHLLEPQVVMREVRRILRPGGALFLTTPNVRGLRARLDGPDWREATRPYHVLLYSFAAARRLLEQVGFASVERVVFSPPTGAGTRNWLWTRCSQATGLYGGLRIVART